MCGVPDGGVAMAEATVKEVIDFIETVLIRSVDRNAVSHARKNEGVENYIYLVLWERVEFKIANNIEGSTEKVY